MEGLEPDLGADTWTLNIPHDPSDDIDDDEFGNDGNDGYKCHGHDGFGSHTRVNDNGKARVAFVMGPKLSHYPQHLAQRILWILSHTMGRAMMTTRMPMVVCYPKHPWWVGIGYMNQ